MGSWLSGMKNLGSNRMDSDSKTLKWEFSDSNWFLQIVFGLIGLLKFKFLAVLVVYLDKLSFWLVGWFQNLKKKKTHNLQICLARYFYLRLLYTVPQYTEYRVMSTVNTEQLYTSSKFSDPEGKGRRQRGNLLRQDPELRWQRTLDTIVDTRHWTLDIRHWTKFLRQNTVHWKLDTGHCKCFHEKIMI